MRADHRINLETRFGACFQDELGGSAVVVGLSREQFVEVAPSRPQFLPVQEILALFRERLEANAREARQFAGIPGGRGSWRRYARF